ncbi:ABC transporter permease [Cytophagales bacterium WSM2-2]|nr:ABC transporter permease [Cytophagales bacterium WSM2-2]
MLRNYFLVAFRNLLKQRLYSVINIGGLTAGLICVTLIYLWVNDEVSKNKYHKDVDRIYRVISNLTLEDGQILTWTITPGPLGEFIRSNIAGVELAARTQRTNMLLQYGDKNLIEDCIYTDPEFFSIFSFKIVQGAQHPIGLDKNSVAISQKLARQLFGNENPIGKIIKGSRKYDLEVKAVFEDIDTNSSITFQFVLPFEIYKETRGGGFNWNNYDHPLYLKLADAGKSAEIQKLINEQVRKTQKREGDDKVEFIMQPFADSYLYSQFEKGVSVGGRIKYVRMFSVVAIFILIIACINFMNMATAKAATRAKEVGVRKVVGAQRPSLVSQFLIESTVISLISMVIALIVVYATLPLFNTMIGKNITVNFFGAAFMAKALLVVLVAGLLAGSYPAFFLSAFRPVIVLKGVIASSLGGTFLRKGLVVFQFVLTVVMGASALVVYRQIQYILNKDVGYDRNGVLTFSITGNLAKQYQAFQAEALQLPGVQKVSRGDNSLVQVNNQNGSVSWPGKPDNSAIMFRTVCVDYDYLEVMGMKLKEGRLFAPQFADSNNFVVTTKAVEVMGLQNPIGQKISQWGTEGTIVGVVDDFHSRSMQEAIDPVIFFHLPKWTWKVFVKFDGHMTSQVVDELTTLHKKYNSEYPFQFTFLDDDFTSLYNNEKVISSLAVVFTALAVIISGLGLFGLAAYTAERRKKEVSIRKIMGASVSGIVTMISQEFIKLSIIACFIGCPLSYYLMSQFLEGYAYHQDLSWDVFLITALATVLLAVGTVIFQVKRTALANPAESLRAE